MILVCVPLLLVSCTVRYSRIKSGYESSERLRLKRIMLLVESAHTDEKIRKLFAAVAREYISHHKEYIFFPKLLDPAVDLVSHCAKEKLDGILTVRFYRLEKREGQVDMEVQSALYGCSTPAIVWEALARNNYASQDSDLTTLTTSYTNRIGPEIADYAAPFYLIERKLFESLPDPLLTEEDIEAKIEADSL